MSQSSEKKAFINALCAVLLWSTVATAFKIALAENSVITLLSGASLTSLICLAIVLGFQGKLLPALKLFRSNFKNTVLLGSINPVIYYLVLFEAYRRLPAQVAQPVNYTWAITLALLSVPILHHKLTKNDLFGLILGYGGVAIISIAGRNVSGSLDMFGLFLAIASTLLWAGFWLLNTRNALDPIIALFHNFLVAVPVLLVLFFIFEASSFDGSLKSTLSIVYVGLFEMGFTFILWQTALHQTKHTARIGTLIFLSPFISLFLISFVLKEPLQWQTFAGLGLIVAGVFLSQRRPKTIDR